MPRILYGGTFDPVHLGHLAIARAVADAFGEPVFLLPAADPPHRPPPGASAHQRAAMLELASAGDPRIKVDRRELNRLGPSYTVDTLAEVREELGPEASIIWVMGIDSLQQLDTWRQWKRLFELAHVLGVERPTGPADPEWLVRHAPAVASEVATRQCRVPELAQAPAGGYAALPMNPLRHESATQVRLRLRQGGDWQSLVPASVAAYIQENGLYRLGDAG
ncbi:MAG: nicotinate (nicotinamide) nucleotide adenylyltransferase [Gammaproteobacteria bacterium RIFCSPHIGHO2_12_FULL_63_22]|nr:MAG: nicotinate (nicotinamide) nucleotide adenylyltransferase [Gammaproteobacteria bacterium RIFCSPHIGHO2_12_FULL_63_22]